MNRKTYREGLHTKIIDALYEAIGGSPWADEVEIALPEILRKVHEAVDASPLMAELFDAPVRNQIPRERQTDLQRAVADVFGDDVGIIAKPLSSEGLAAVKARVPGSTGCRDRGSV
jgi:hypothetical protein